MGNRRAERARVIKWLAVPVFALALVSCEGRQSQEPGEVQEVSDRASTKVVLSGEERAWLKARPDIELGYTDAFEPEVIVDPDGSLRGIQVDILDELNRRMGTRIGLRIYPVPELVKKAQQKEVDGILNLHPGYADELGLLKTRSYFSGYPAVFARRDVPFHSPSDFAGKRVAIIDEVFFSEQIIEQYGKGATIQKVQDAKVGLHCIDSGQADYFLGATLNAYLITKYQLFNLAPQHVFYDYPIDGVMGIRSDWPELVSILDKGLTSFSKEEIEAIVSKWSAVNGISPADIMKWVLIIAGVASVIMLLFVTWNRQLSRKVRERTAEVMESEGRFRATFEQAAVGIAHVSPEGRFLLINQRFCDIVGYSREEMLERAFRDITHPDELDADLEYVNKLLSGKTNTYSMEKRYLRKDGEIVWVNLTVSLLREDTGEPKWFVSVVQDITERKQAEEKLRDAEREKALVLDNTDGIVAFHNMNHGIQWANRAYLKATGLSLSEVKGRKCYHVWRLGRLCNKCPVTKAIETGEHQDAELTPENQEHWPSDQGSWMVRAAPVKDDAGRIIGAIEVAYDITERKRSEQDIQGYQQRLRALASELTLAEERERRRIAADLHDHVGQSLALARMQLAAARKSTSDSALTAMLDDVSDTLFETVQDTRHIIHDLSSPSMNEIGLAAALSEWLGEHIEKQHSLTTEFVDECGIVPLDDDVRAIVFRSVRELLTNVVKHAQADKVSVCLKRAGEHLTVIVQDDGVGFDPSAAPSIMGQEGGFGLFSIRERMADLGGSLEIVSERGKGCKAILTAPLLSEDRRETK